MALSTQTVTGTIYYPDGSPMSEAFITFTLSNPQTSTADSGTIPPSTVTDTTDSLGLFSLELWPNSLGSTDSVYYVDVSYTDNISGKYTSKRLGEIRVPASGEPHTLASLLAAGQVFPNAVYLGVITEEQYQEILDSVDAAAISAAIAGAAVGDARKGLLNALSDEEGVLENWHFGAQQPGTVLANLKGYKDLPEFSLVGDLIDTLDDTYNTVAAFMAATVDDTVLQVVVARVRLIRDAGSGTIIQDDGTKWALYGPASFETRAQAVSWVSAIQSYNSSTFASGDIVDWAGTYAVVFSSGATDISDIPDFVPIGDITPEHFGDNTTPGTTDVSDYVVDAASYGPSTLDHTTYAVTGRIDFTNSVKGHGTTFHILDTAGANVGYAFLPPNDGVIDGINVTHASGEYNRTFDLSEGVSNFHLTNAVIDQGLEPFSETATEPNNYSAVFKYTNADNDNIKVSFCDFRNGFWGILKGNTDESNDSKISFIGNTFDRMNSVALLFNSPDAASSMEEMVVMGNILGGNYATQPLGGTNSSFAHRATFAGHTSYGTFIGNIGSGPGQELLRSEEAAKAITVVGNSAKLTGKDGIEIIANNAGGTAYTPTYFSVIGNTLVNEGLDTTFDDLVEYGIGLQVNTTVSGLEDMEPLGESVLIGNSLAGWQYGLWAHQGSQRVGAIGNYITSGGAAYFDDPGTITDDVGIYTKSPSVGWHDNFIADTTYAVQFNRGGMIGKQHFRSKNATPAKVQIKVDNGVGVMRGWSWETGRRSFVNGYTYIDLIEIGDKMQGRIYASLQNDTGTLSSVGSWDITWDGTTLTATEDSISNSDVGGVVIAGAPFIHSSGDLQISIFNSSGTTADDLRLQVDFDGRHEWS